MNIREDGLFLRAFPIRGTIFSEEMSRGYFCAIRDCVISNGVPMMDSPGHHEFVTTHWSLVAAAKPDEASARRALEELCRMYWYPLYAFVRYRGYPADDAQDLTQSFFTQLIEKGGIATADPERGRFRSFLLGAMKHFLANEWHKGKAQKRGGQVDIIEWDSLDPEGRYAGSAHPSEDPECLFDREWALELIAGALRSLRDEMERMGKGDQFDVLKGCLTGEGSLSREVMAEQLNMSEGSLKVAIHRLRQRYRHLLRAAIAETVASEEELEDEMRYLVEILRKS